MSDGLFERYITIGEDGTALANSTTPTNILPSSRAPIIPANYFDRVGKPARVGFRGRISTVVTTPGTLTLELMFGSIAVASSGALALNTTAQTNVGWHLDWDLVLASIGSGTAATLKQQGLFRSHAVIGSAAPSAGGAGCHLLPFNTAPAVGSGFDATAAQTVGLRATWSVASASNSLQLHSGWLDLVTG